MKHAAREGVDDEDNVQMMKEMTLNGLMYDFFGNTDQEPTEEHSEKDFHIVVDDGTVKYKIRGFIDKLFLYKDKKFALIRDFKTSKETFKGKDAEDNMQDLMYSLAVKHLFPEYETKQSEFLFLKFDLIPDVKKIYLFFIFLKCHSSILLLFMIFVHLPAIIYHFHDFFTACGCFFSTLGK